MTLSLRPKHGGFLRSFGCGSFIREFLLGHGPNGSAMIDPNIGSPQADIFRNYKTALMKTTAIDRAIRTEEKRARREDRSIDPEKILVLADEYLDKMPYKAQGARFHSFIVYFSMLKRLNWVEATGRQEPSAFQENYPPGPLRKYFRLTNKGRNASEGAWSNPHLALYGTG